MRDQTCKTLLTIRTSPRTPPRGCLYATLLQCLTHTIDYTRMSASSLSFVIGLSGCFKNQRSDLCSYFGHQEHKRGRKNSALQSLNWLGQECWKKSANKGASLGFCCRIYFLFLGVYFFFYLIDKIQPTINPIRPDF